MCVAFVAWVAVVALVALVALVIWFSNSERLLSLWCIEFSEILKSYLPVRMGSGASLRKELLTKRIIRSEIYTTSVFECHKCV